MVETQSQEETLEPLPLAPAPQQTPSFTRRIRRALLGSPLSSAHMEHTLLPKILALPVFASDAISSVAYATQQIILALGAAGLGVATLASYYSNYTLLVASAIVVLLVIVATSYWQTIFAYPSGGGSYIVSKDNLGTKAGLVAGAALLIDYVLTVSVSIAAGVQNLASIPFVDKYLHPEQHLTLYCLLFIALLTLANLRGLKESGAMFAVFTYGFVGMCYVMIVLGILGPLIGWTMHMDDINHLNAIYATQTVRATQLGGFAIVLVLLRAFANGCSAMTGVEAVSNGIPAFQPPKSRNAALTLLAMAAILGTIFVGISWLTVSLHVVYWEGQKVLAPAVIDQLSGAVFGKRGPFSFAYLLTQFFTAGILVLAANTSYADFPRLASIMARDRFLPKQFSNLGDKLVFNNGIMLLGLFAAILIILFKGSVDSLIPLYAIGVFLAFTLSQSGMVMHWRHSQESGWQRRAIINGIGALATGIVLLDIACEKFLEGAWSVMLLIGLLYLMFLKIHAHYADVAQQLSMSRYHPPHTRFKNTVLVLIPSLHRGVMPALEYARSLSPDCRALHIETDLEKTPALRAKWEEYGGDVPLVVLNSPYRSLISPIMKYLDAVQVERRNHIVTVIVPEFVPTKWWHTILHGNSGLLLKIALLGRKDVIVANVRYYLQESDEPPTDAALREEEAELKALKPGAEGVAAHDH